MTTLDVFWVVVFVLLLVALVLVFRWERRRHLADRARARRVRDALLDLAAQDAALRGRAPRGCPHCGWEADHAYHCPTMGNLPLPQQLADALGCCRVCGRDNPTHATLCPLRPVTADGGAR